MAFNVKIEKLRTGGGGPKNETDIKLSRCFVNGSMQCSFPAKVAASVGIELGQRVDVVMGTGEDEGRFAIMQGTSFKVSKDGDKAFRLKFATAGLLPHIKELAVTVVKFSVIGTVIVVDIPERLRASSIKAVAA
jgi:hypothetical protein